MCDGHNDCGFDFDEEDCVETSGWSSVLSHERMVAFVRFDILATIQRHNMSRDMTKPAK